MMRKRSFQKKTNLWIMLQSPPEAHKMGFFQDKTTQGDPFRSTENAPLLLSEGQTAGHSLSLVKLCLFHALFAVMESSALSQRNSCITGDFSWPSALPLFSKAHLWAQRPPSCLKDLWTWISEHVPDQFCWLWLLTDRWAISTENKYSGRHNVYWNNSGFFHMYLELRELLARLEMRGWPRERQSLDVLSHFLRNKPGTECIRTFVAKVSCHVLTQFKYNHYSGF